MITMSRSNQFIVRRENHQEGGPGGERIVRAAHAHSGHPVRQTGRSRRRLRGKFAWRHLERVATNQSLFGDGVQQTLLVGLIESPSAATPDLSVEGQ